MFDPNDTVLKTFNYYQDKSELGFIQTRVTDQSMFVGRRIKDLDTCENESTVMLQTAQGRVEVPRGDTILQANDRVVLLQGEKLQEAIDHQSGQ